uniref:uncharacterized protein LOC122583980 n=1 Tax=Erigeron canadensis TaxID=72917 RepID=UPI001CB9941D|nr:uncharacterized protein LOC122583980 [Erigeron canadensis]
MEEDAGEFIVIGVDNCRSVPLGSDILQNLCDAIETYCRAKFEENPKTLVGLYKMSSTDSEHFLHPTGSIDKIIAKFPYINPGSGYVDLEGMFSSGFMPLSRHSMFFSQNKIRQKRAVIFTGGLTYLSMHCVKQAATRFRARGVAIDVIDFYSGVTPRYLYPDSPYPKTELEA